MYAAVASALMRTTMFISRPPKTQSVRPITPIVIQPSVPECRCVSSALRSSAPKTCVAFARPRSAVSVKIASPYWNADRTSIRDNDLSMPLSPSLVLPRARLDLARPGVEGYDLQVLRERRARHRELRDGLDLLHAELVQQAGVRRVLLHVVG